MNQIMHSKLTSSMETSTESSHRRSRSRSRERQGHGCHRSRSREHQGHGCHRPRSREHQGHGCHRSRSREHQGHGCHRPRSREHQGHGCHRSLSREHHREGCHRSLSREHQGHGCHRPLSREHQGHGCHRPRSRERQGQECHRPRSREHQGHRCHRSWSREHQGPRHPSGDHYYRSRHPSQPTSERRGAIPPPLAERNTVTFPELWGTFMSKEMEDEMEAWRLEAEADPYFAKVFEKQGNNSEKGISRKRGREEEEGEDVAETSKRQKTYTSTVHVNPKHPAFSKANAVIEIAPIPDKHKYKVGWIQACTDMVFHNTYGDDGYTSWLFPELNSGAQTMINDCDGKNYPWYGSHDETVTFDGPCNMYQSATITMHDNFHPHVTWRNPADNTTGPANLTRISRDQSFYVWLVVWDMTLGKAYVMKTIKWNMNLDIKVDPSKSLGKRAKLVSDPVQKQPLVLEETISIPRCALMPPNANHAQMLVWCPTDGNALLIIRPIWKNDVPIERQVPPHDSRLCNL